MQIKKAILKCAENIAQSKLFFDNLDIYCVSLPFSNDVER